MRKKEELEKLMKERILLNQLIYINPSYKELLGARAQEIKTIINTYHVDTTHTPDMAFPMYSMEMATAITTSAMEHIREFNSHLPYPVHSLKLVKIIAEDAIKDMKEINNE